MTGPVTTEALADQIEAKMKAMSLLGGDALRAATHDLGSLAYIHSTQIVRALRSEAAHQQVTAERDEYAEALMKVAEVGGWQASAGLAAEVQSALARLRAEGEALKADLEGANAVIVAYREAICSVAKSHRAVEAAEQRENERLRQHPIIRGAARAATAREGA